MDKWNVPGSADYTPEKPLDTILTARTDQELRGYWLARDRDGQLCLVSNQNNADYVIFDVDEDGTKLAHYDDEETTEFSYDGIHTIRVKRYS